MKTFVPISVDCVQTHAVVGSELYNCAKAAAIMALSEEREVRFVHSDRTYVACPDALKAIVIATEIKGTSE